jgi:YHS domain-containing protein
VFRRSLLRTKLCNCFAGGRKRLRMEPRYHLYPPVKTSESEGSEEACMKVTDPVCKMEIDPKAAGQSAYKGQTYYFCATGCKTAFDKSPEKYITKTR